ncbi:hypothetical protein ACFVG1_36645 [Streptomyces bacillaris]|uniref:hypothetical protein n=1 Tax=Actinomycetes TaxID=1760 RepID=UPI003642D918
MDPIAVPTDPETLAEAISAAADAYFTQVDPEDTNTDDLAWTIIRYLQHPPPTTD